MALERHSKVKCICTEVLAVCMTLHEAKFKQSIELHELHNAQEYSIDLRYTIDHPRNPWPGSPAMSPHSGVEYKYICHIN